MRGEVLVRAGHIRDGVLQAAMDKEPSARSRGMEGFIVFVCFFLGLFVRLFR